MMTCCSKVICKGCSHANQIREAERRERRLEHNCPFCRQPVQGDKLEKQRMKRIEANDRVAMRQEGSEQYRKGDHNKAFEYYTKASELGDVEAHFKLSLLYHQGHGVEKDMGMEIHHLEEATIGGHPDARYNLGCHEWNNNNKERAVKHLTIAATQGDNKSIKFLLHAYKGGFVKKEVLDAALHAHQAAVDATKSPQRDAADIYDKIR
eukprot:scaffold17545_cov81-Skeletonema_dohrnii-CCMP3373.AAC.4